MEAQQPLPDSLRTNASQEASKARPDVNKLITVLYNIYVFAFLHP